MSGSYPTKAVALLFGESRAYGRNGDQEFQYRKLLVEKFSSLWNVQNVIFIETS